MAGRGARSSGDGVLLVTDVRFWRRKLGSQARISALIDWLERSGRRCTVLFMGSLVADDSQQVAERCAGLDFLTVHQLPEPADGRRWDTAALASAVRHKLHVFRHRLSRQTAPLSFDSNFRPEYRARFQTYLDKRKPASVIIEYARLAYLLNGADTLQLQTIVDTHDVLHQRWAAFAGSDRSGLIRTTAAQEAAVLRRFDHVIAIQHEDAAHLRQAMSLPSVIVAMHAQQVRALPWQPGNEILMVGSNMPPNVDGARAFLQLWPRVFERLHRKVTLHMVGAMCEALASHQNLPGVQLHGQVDALQSFYERAQLVINPVAYGSGLKIKSVEALCHGRPLLTLESGAEGLLPAGAPEAFVVVPSVAELAEACVRLMLDETRLRSLSERAADYAQLHFAPDSAYAELAALLDGK